jgi:hypothetical protein
MKVLVGIGRKGFNIITLEPVNINSGGRVEDFGYGHLFFYDEAEFSIFIKMKVVS